MGSQISEIAERIKGMRELYGYSVEKMASALGMEPAEYSFYEDGAKDFSFTFIYKCAELFNVGITELISGEDAKLTSYTIERKGKGLEVNRRAGFRYLHLASRIQGRIAEPFMVTAPYFEEEQNKDIHTSTHVGQEMDYILSGSLRVVIDGHEEILNEGDTIYYDSGLPHGMIAVGGKECKFLAIVMK